MTAAFFALAIPAVMFAGISKGGFGSGAAFAASAFLALAMPPAAAVGLMMPLLMLMDVAALRAYWRRWDQPIALAMAVGALPGVVLAALVWSRVDADALRLAIGAIALAFVAFQVARTRGWLRISPAPHRPAVAAGWGMAAGFTSFVSHAGGPPAAVYLLSQQLTKGRYQATSVAVFFAINLMKAPAYVALGLVTADSLLAGALLAPVAVLGVWCGVRLHRVVSERLFFGLTYAFLVITGAKLIFDALT